VPKFKVKGHSFRALDHATATFIRELERRITEKRGGGLEPTMEGAE
jgi:hypothetical protein